MRYLIYVLVAFLSVFCFSKAIAQTSTFGTTSPTGFSKTVGTLWLSKYADADSVDNVLAVDVEGKVYKTSGGTPFDTTTIYAALSDTAAVLREDMRLKSTLLGTIYRAASWSNLDTFFTPMTGINISGGNISFTTGSANRDSFMGLDRRTLLDHWDMTGRFVVGSKNATNFQGFGMGMRGYAGYEATCYTIFNMSSNSVSGGKLYYVNYNNLRDSSAAKISFSIGDTLLYRCYYDWDKVGIYASVKNLRNDSVVSIEYTGVEADAIFAGNNAQLTYSSGYLSIFPKGGSFVLDSLDISSRTLKYADLAIIGDSKSWNADVSNVLKGWVKQIKVFFVNTAALAGSGEWVIDVVNRLPEIIELQPKQVLLNIGFNSFFAGVPDDTINAQYSMIVDSLENNGIRVIKMLPQYDAVDQSTLRAFILANYDEADIIDLYAVTAACGAACLDFNQIHPNDSGSTIIADGILASGKVWGAKGGDGLVDIASIQWRQDISDSIQGISGGISYSDTTSLIPTKSFLSINYLAKSDTSALLATKSFLTSTYLPYTGAITGLVMGNNTITGRKITTDTLATIANGRLVIGAGNLYWAGRNSGTGILEFFGTQSGANGYRFGGANGDLLTVANSGNTFAKGTISSADIPTVTTYDSVCVINSGVLNKILFKVSASATLDFPSTPTNDNSDLTIVVAGAVVGDVVAIGHGLTAQGTFEADVSAANTVNIRFHNTAAGAYDPPSDTFKVIVFK